MSTAKRPRWPYPHVTRMHAHASGQWAKKIDGRRVYFGVWGDPKAALERWRWTAARQDQPTTPPATPSDLVTLDRVVNRWLVYQIDRVDAGELSPQTLRDYRDVSQWLLDRFGEEATIADLGPAEWADARLALARQYGLRRQTKIVTVTRSIMRWAEKSEVIAKPVRFGPNWETPGTRAIRAHSAARKVAAPRLFTPAEIQRLLTLADAKMNAMIWLACNAALGQTDIATIEAQHVQGDWLMLPRQKTGVLRRVPLWRETRAALKPIIAVHTEGLLFPTRFGRSSVRVQTTADGELVSVDAVSSQFAKLARLAKVKRTFYDFRRTFRTVLDAHPDAHAVDAIMGHVPPGMGADYVQRIEDRRRASVVGVMRAWLKRPSGNRAASQPASASRRARQA